MSTGGILDKQFNSFVPSPTRGAPNAAREVTIGNFKEIENFKSKTSYDELKVTNKFTQIQLSSSIASVSKIRNVVTENGSATVEVGDTGEYKLSTTALANDSCILESGERGVYIPGYDAQFGIGLRLGDTNYSGDALVEWGYIDLVSGIGYGFDASGFYVFTLTDSVKTKIYQADFNTDKVDGTGPSGATLSLTNGNIFQCEFSWYGYGVIRFNVLIKNVNATNGIDYITMHKLIINETVSIEQPNLPIKVLVNNNTSAATREVFVGGRQFSIFGLNPNVFRINGNYRLNTALSTTDWRPVVSFRRKAGLFSNQNVKINEVTAVANNDCVIAFTTNPTLTGASFGALRDISADETCLESDISATAISNGTFFGGYHLVRGGNQSVVSETIQLLNYSFIGKEIVSVVAKGLSSNTTMDFCLFNVLEEW